jgi:dUTP pyrophosphatase
MDLKIKRMGDVEVPLPKYQTAGAVGMDLQAALTAPETIAPGERKIVPTGFAVAIPVGYEAQIRPRSGMAIKQGITVINSPGTIDSDFRGQIKVGLINLGTESVTINPMDRIAQMVICPIKIVTLELTDALDENDRNDGALGSTGNR